FKKRMLVAAGCAPRGEDVQYGHMPAAEILAREARHRAAVGMAQSFERRQREIRRVAADQGRGQGRGVARVQTEIEQPDQSREQDEREKNAKTAHQSRPNRDSRWARIRACARYPAMPHTTSTATTTPVNP